MNTSEASLAFCMSELRQGLTPQAVAALVKEKFTGKELDIALEWLRGQHTIGKRSTFNNHGSLSHKATPTVNLFLKRK